MKGRGAASAKARGGGGGGGGGEVAARAPVEVSIEREEVDEKTWSTWRRYHLAVVRFDDRIIETVNTEDADYADKWVRYMAREHRKRRAPLVAGLAAFTGSPADYCWRRRPYGPQIAGPALRALALCLGGSHVLVFQLDFYDGPLAALPRSLRDFLEDRRVAVVAIGAEVLAKNLERECGVKLGNPVEIRTLVAKAFGRDKAYRFKFGRKLAMEGMPLEEMAEEVVTGGQPVEKKPASFADASWYNDLPDVQVMHSTLDAFLCFEIGVKCLEATGQPT